MKHPDRILDYPHSLPKLAEDVGDMRYYALAEFLSSLADKLARDGDADAARGRTQLSASLRRAASTIADAAREIEKTQAICAPHEK